MMEDKDNTGLLDAEDFAELLFSRRTPSQNYGYYGLGVVRSVKGDRVSVSLDSSLNSKSKSRRYLSNYKPSKGDRVLILHDIVIGKIK